MTHSKTIKNYVGIKNVVYKIENLLTGGTYIGSTKEFFQRKRGHLHSLRRSKHHSEALQVDFNKYGEHCLLFSILEFCESESDLIKREQFYMNLYNPVYNTAPMAGSMRGFKFSEASLKKLSNSHKGKKISEKEIERRRASFMGNKKGVGNKNRKLSEDKIQKIKDLRAAGLGCRRIAAAVGVNKTTVLNIFNKNTIDMGQISEDLIDGTSCELCGQYFKDPKKEGYAYTHGYPVVCHDCWHELTDKEKEDRQKAKVSTF